ncbi:DUF2092 domain-containing protein [Sulfurovum riftiae]|uniref:Cyclic nucleotide-binding domain-containing protein n=1 Tax=Sulfurovum riftiae TaxID=1630136 RepID=A0A151CFI1_9BACT|nr:DUF2092 domain-containing protein [Sulfurovum riftiae]KYJ86257.1 hypothetical protein AS592_05525 [Sulfurovum riftiae]
MTLYKRILCIAGLGVVLGNTSLFAAEQSAASIVKHAYQYIGSLDKYTFNAIVTEDAMEKGKLLKQYKQYVSVKVDRPDNLRVDTKGDIKKRTSYLHDGTFTMIDHDFNYYGQIKLPHKSIDKALDYIFDRYGIKAPLAALIYSDMHKRSKFTKSTYFGKRTIDGAEYDYVAFRNRGGEVHAWISSGEKPLVKYFTIIDTTVKGKPRTTASIKWDTDPRLSEKDFIFKAPRGASNISVESAK